MVILPYDTKSKSRNADFISIAAERQSATLGAKGPVKPKNPWAEGPSILRTFPSEPFEPSEPYEPSRRRRVQLPLENFPIFLYNKKKKGVTPLLIEKELL